MWTRQLNQGIPQKEIDGISNDDLAGQQRAFDGPKTLEICLVKPHAALICLKSKVNMPCLLAWSHFLSLSPPPPIP